MTAINATSSASFAPPQASMPSSAGASAPATPEAGNGGQGAAVGNVTCSSQSSTTSASVTQMSEKVGSFLNDVAPGLGDDQAMRMLLAVLILKMLNKDDSEDDKSGGAMVLAAALAGKNDPLSGLTSSMQNTMSSESTTTTTAAQAGQSYVAQAGPATGGSVNITG